LRESAAEYARLMAQEMGKPITQGRAEVEKCAWVCEYYAEEGARFLADEAIPTDAGQSFVTFRPLGVVLAIMPWNFPFWQVIRFAAPTLMAGNTAVLKHASNVPGCALALEDLFRRAGFPPDVFRTVLVDSKVAQQLIKHRAVRAVTLTGSSAAGRAVGKQAGAHLRKTVLELGGSDPYLVLADADLDQAVETCVQSRLINSGQSCIAAKRFIVVDAVREDFTRRFVERMARARVGDPLEAGTEVGPQARRDLRDGLHEQVERSVADGAQVLLGGSPPAGDGSFYPPTVLAEVTKGMAAFDEELFGPVAAIVPARDEKAAIRAANDGPYGLGAAVFTQDEARGRRIAATALEAGSCFVNGLVKSDPRLPFGGIKSSGYGRELGGWGIREFVNVKTVWIR
ncbi:MAG TPA: NAD-dependent succinate-semialdehyde dehydrogenase, partial [Gemmatimonadales bacterium]|nr:NAD-dependent succinate-semialdehyde dehydrogenase [Gemmatimonadales bacterium]